MNFSIFLIIISALAVFGKKKIKNKTSDVINKPHIILIIADDMGWNDVSFHGANQIPTPNIDALAYNGVILNRHYVAPTCTPSRTSLLTGRFATREGLNGNPLNAGDTRGLLLDTPLIPKYLKNLGYSSHLLGKWHLGYMTKDNTPANRGFDQFFGYYNGMISYFNHTTRQTVNKTMVLTAHDLHRDTPDNLTIAYDSKKYFTDLITDEAEKIIKKNNNKKPLYLQIAHLAPHASDEANDPLEVRDMDEVDKNLGHIKDIKRRKYAGMVTAMDESVGRILTALSDADMLKNSIIVFMSDNGAPAESKTANNGSNYPLRGMKHTLFEGGVRGAACIFSPLIEKKSRVSNDMMHMVDWLPTLLSVAGGNLNKLNKVIDGLNQWPTISKGKPSPRNSMLVDIDDEVGEGAIIGNHKLIKVIKKKGSNYYGDSGNDPSYPEYDVKNVLNSPVALAIKKLNGITIPTKKQALKLRKNSTVVCSSQNKTELQCKDDICLFDINKDPCETRDLSDEPKSSKIIKELKDLINKYKKDMLQSNKTIDPCSYPSYFNNTFMPWMDKNISPSSDNNCQHPNYQFLSK